MDGARKSLLVRCWAMKGDERGEQRKGVFRDELGELMGNAVGRGSRTSSDAFQGRRWKEWSVPDEGGFCITRSVTKGRRVEGNGGLSTGRYNESCCFAVFCLSKS